MLFEKNKFYSQFCFKENYEKTCIPLITNLNIKSFDFYFEKEEKFFTKEAKEFIEKTWREEIEKNPNIANGKLFDIAKIELKNSKISIFYDETNYKDYLGTKKYEYRKYFETGNYFSNHASSASIIFTKDNKIIIGEKKIKDTFSLVGGMIDFKDAEFKNPFEACLEREIKEEIGNLNIKSKKFIGIFINTKTNHINILYHVFLNDTAKEIKNIHEYNLKNGLIDKEVDNLIIIENNKNSINDLIVKFDAKIKGVLRSALENLLIL